MKLKMLDGNAQKKNNNTFAIQTSHKQWQSYEAEKRELKCLSFFSSFPRFVLFHFSLSTLLVVKWASDPLPNARIL